jgi:cytochrome c553
MMNTSIHPSMKGLRYIVLLVIVSFIIITNKTKKKYKPHKPIQSNELQESINRGNDIFAGFCLSCHLLNGKGVKHTYPRLADSDYLKNNRDASIKGIKYGLKGEIIVNGDTYNNYMRQLDWVMIKLRM